MGHVESKTRSLGQILEKPCVRCRGHIFSPIIIKLGQNVSLAEISDDFENVSCRVHKPCVRSRDQIFCLILMELGQSVCLDEILYMFENDPTRVAQW